MIMAGKDLDKTKLKIKAYREIEAGKVVERISLKGIASELVMRYICKKDLIYFRVETPKMQETEQEHATVHNIHWARSSRSQMK